MSNTKAQLTPGFYWVKLEFENEWVVASYSDPSHTYPWTIPGNDGIFDDTELGEIGPRIEREPSGWVSVEPEWVVNDNAELGVKIGDRFYFLYKGNSLVYRDGKHDDGRQMFWRLVGKREFGECCHPVTFWEKGGHAQDFKLSAPDERWQPLPAPPTVPDKPLTP